MHLDDEVGIDTILAHYGEEEKPHGAVVPPLYQNSLFVFDDVDDLHRAMLESPEGPPYHYSRVGNPTLALAEKKLAKLEGAEACKLAGTGMGAISMAMLSCLDHGCHVVAIDTAYPPAKKLLDDYMARYGVQTTYVDGRDPQTVLDAIRPETSLIYLESPSSFLFRMQDLPAITRVAREKGITTMIDNTYNTPLHLQPARLGVDLIVHSGTKYFGGHSDLTAGVVCGSEAHLGRMVRNEIALLGGILSPFAAWLMTRGLRTLSVRLARHEETANRVAQWLEGRPEVERVHHLGLESYPQRALVCRDLKGTGGIFSFVPKTQEKEKVRAFCNALRLFQRGISWGGFESLVVPLHVRSLETEPHWVIRLFCGLEDPRDLLRDLERAMPHLSES